MTIANQQVLDAIGKEALGAEVLLHRIMSREKCSLEESRTAVWRMLGSNLLELDDNWHIKAVPPDQLKDA